MLLRQIITDTMTAQTIVQLRSAVVERRKPVRPINVPQMELAKIVPTKGAQCRLCLPIDCSSMLYSMETTFSTIT